MKVYKWVGAGVASLVMGASVVVGQDVVADAPVAGGHVHDENCNHEHAEVKVPSVEEVRAFLKANAAYVLPEFEKVINGDDEEHLVWMMKDISGVMAEYDALKKFDPKVAVTFTEVLQLENELHLAIGEKLKAGEKPAAVGEAVKGQLKALIAKRLELRKGQIALDKLKLDEELKELGESLEKVDEITETELKGIIKELEQTHGAGGE